jgi:hypothetical protein
MCSRTVNGIRRFWVPATGTRSSTESMLRSPGYSSRCTCRRFSDRPGDGAEADKGAEFTKPGDARMICGCSACACHDLNVETHPDGYMKKFHCDDIGARGDRKSHFHGASRKKLSPSPKVLVSGLGVDSSGSANVPMSATQPFVEIRMWFPSYAMGAPQVNELADRSTPRQIAETPDRGLVWSSASVRAFRDGEGKDAPRSQCSSHPPPRASSASSVRKRWSSRRVKWGVT